MSAFIYVEQGEIVIYYIVVFRLSAEICTFGLSMQRIPVYCTPPLYTVLIILDLSRVRTLGTHCVRLKQFRDKHTFVARNNKFGNPTERNAIVVRGP